VRLMIKQVGETGEVDEKDSEGWRVAQQPR
jgi:hypothetical protein